MMQPQINHATGLHHVLPGNVTANDFKGGFAFEQEQESREYQVRRPIGLNRSEIIRILVVLKNLDF